MIGCFPVAYAEEIVYGICSRYVKRMRYPNKMVIIEELFGIQNAALAVDLPRRLDHLIDALPPGHTYTADWFIDAHTLFPCYAPFLTAQRRQHVRETMRTERGFINNQPMPVGSASRRLDYLRFCPTCAADDVARHGEPYWHRVHQAPWVLVCPHHAVHLQDSDVPVRERSYKSLLTPAAQAVRTFAARDVDPADRDDAALLALAEDTMWLFAHADITATIDLASLRRRYRRALWGQGRASAAGRVDLQTLVDDVRAFYSPHMLRTLGCVIDDPTRNNWVARLVHDDEHVMPPVQHLLMMRFLGYTPQQFFALAEEDESFGRAPWPCLNRASDHFEELVVDTCAIDYRRTGARVSPVGTFSCRCGFVYRRTGPDTDPKDRFRMGVVEQYGEAWDATLRTLWADSDVTLANIATRLDVCQPTVRKQALRLDLPFPRFRGRMVPTPSVPLASPVPSTPAQPYRDAWLAAQRACPDAGVRDLQRRHPGIFTWLYNHDRTWLDQHKPAKKVRALPEIDWAERDRAMAKAVKESASRLRNTPDRPLRVSLEKLGKDIGHQHLLRKHLEMLPLTEQALADAVETLGEVGVRRVGWIAERCMEQGAHLSKTELARQASVDHIIDAPTIAQALDDVIAVMAKPASGGTC